MIILKYLNVCNSLLNKDYRKDEKQEALIDGGRGLATVTGKF